MLSHLSCNVGQTDFVYCKLTPKCQRVFTMHSFHLVFFLFTLISDIDLVQPLARRNPTEISLLNLSQSLIKLMSATHGLRPVMHLRLSGTSTLCGQFKDFFPPHMFLIDYQMANSAGQRIVHHSQHEALGLTILSEVSLLSYRWVLCSH